MSSPSTPVRSDKFSMTPTPESNHEGPSPTLLTPRSKVRAMLAALDQESDSEALNNVQGVSISGCARPSSNGAVQLQDSSSLEGDLSDKQSRYTGSDSDVVAPRGKLAARLHAQDIKTQRQPEDQEIEYGVSNNAYERVKQQLAPRTSPSGQEVMESAEQLPSKGLVLTRKFLLKKKKPAIVSSEIDKLSESLPVHHCSSPARSLSPASNDSRHSSTRAASRGLVLFPTAPKAAREQHEGSSDTASDLDLPRDPQTNPRLRALVEKKRKERLARAADEERGRIERQSSLTAQRKKAHTSPALSAGSSEDDADEDEAAGAKLTQQTRPARKASKKALEEMSRETQRMNRNMQLAHQAKTKKKISKASFLSRFATSHAPKSVASSAYPGGSSTAVSSAPVSDADAMNGHQTPPTSPALSNPRSISPQKDRVVPPSRLERQIQEQQDEFPAVEDIIAESSRSVDKGKGRAVDDHPLPEPKKPVFTQPPIKIKLPIIPGSGSEILLDSESDLEIRRTPKNKSRKLDIFDKVKPKIATEGQSLHILRALAHINSPGKQNTSTRTSLTPAQLQSSLQKRARQQAAQERAEKIQDLQDRGIIIQTAEERHRDQVVVEDLMEKARREGEEIMKKEKILARKEQRKDGEIVESSDEDEDYDERSVDLAKIEAEEEADDEEQEDDSEVNSEDEEVDDDDEEDIGTQGDGDTMDRDTTTAASFIAAEASEDDQDEEETNLDPNGFDGDDIDEEIHVPQNRRRKKGNQILDDEDENNVNAEIEETLVSHEQTRNPIMPNLLGSDEAPMGLTQAFAATMAESQSQEEFCELREEDQQDSLRYLRDLPKLGDSTPLLEPTETLIIDSQRESVDIHQGDTTQAADITLHLSQSEPQDMPNAQEQDVPLATQYSDIPDPTQDAGFGLVSPFANRFAPVPPSTVDTVLINDPAQEVSPIAKKKGRLLKRADVIPALSVSNEGEEAHPSLEPNGFVVSADAFEVPKKAGKKTARTVESFDKKKSNAKGMVEEQAEESEDEYAGLGGASDDESGGEEDEEVRKMIDEGEVKVDERELAAFYADKERATDQKAVSKLFNDLSNGLLRRKRGADFDLSDSDDNLEARRRAKRREFAKMRKALLENENVGKIAEDPKKLAFLRAIEDRDTNDDDLDNDFLAQPNPDTQIVPDSQTTEPTSQDQTSLPERVGSKRKRPLQDSLPDSGNRLPAPARRVPTMKKPATLAEIRDSVSFLIENPALQEQFGPASDDEDPPASSSPPPPPRHHPEPVINRLHLKRATSTSLSTTTTTTRLAFHDPATEAQAPGFKVPSLLRRATTQGTVNGGVVAGTERAAGGREGESVRRGAGKSCSVNWYRREERREGRGRKEVLRKRVGAGVLGVLGAGRFE